MAAALATTLLAPAGAQERPAPSADVSSWLAGTPCEAAARRELTVWAARLDGALQDPPAPDGARSARIPTDTPGRWMRVTVGPSGSSLECVSATSLERVTFDADCAAQRTTHPQPPPAPGSFGDAQLLARLARHERGVVMAWSPHMPLSVDEHAELQATARALELSVVLVLDPLADVTFARRVAAERGLPPGATAPLASIELAFRGMTTHTPSFQLFAAGRLVGPVLYGYRDRATLTAALTAILDAP